LYLDYEFVKIFGSNFKSAAGSKKNGMEIL